VCVCVCVCVRVSLTLYSFSRFHRCVTVKGKVVLITHLIAHSRLRGNEVQETASPTRVTLMSSKRMDGRKYSLSHRKRERVSERERERERECEIDRERHTHTHTHTCTHSVYLSDDEQSVTTESASLRRFIPQKNVSYIVFLL
jgi:hypothetical protein